MILDSVTAMPSIHEEDRRSWEDTTPAVEIVALRGWLPDEAIPDEYSAVRDEPGFQPLPLRAAS
jgi:hypothetical protein